MKPFWKRNQPVKTRLDLIVEATAKAAETRLRSDIDAIMTLICSQALPLIDWANKDSRRMLTFEDNGAHLAFEDMDGDRRTVILSYEKLRLLPIGVKMKEIDQLVGASSPIIEDR